MKNLLFKPPVKHAILAFLTAAIGISSSFISTCNSLLVWLLTIGFAIAYIVVTAIYATTEVNSRRVTSVQEHQLKAFKDMTNNIISISQETADAVNRCIHDANKNGKINLNIWGFKSACQSICHCVFNTTKQLGNSEKYTVEYVRLIEDGKEDSVETIGYANQNSQAPGTYRRPRVFINADDHSFRDLYLFKCSKSDIDILFSEEDLNNNLSNRKDKTLYIGIPVFCHDEKMVGLLQIIGKDNSKLGCLAKSEVEEVVSKFFVPYANLFLLMHKMEKALFVGVPNNLTGTLRGAC